MRVIEANDTAPNNKRGTWQTATNIKACQGGYKDVSDTLSWRIDTAFLIVVVECNIQRRYYIHVVIPLRKELLTSIDELWKVILSALTSISRRRSSRFSRMRIILPFLWFLVANFLRRTMMFPVAVASTSSV